MTYAGDFDVVPFVMQIDRSRFLLLTMTLSGGGCGGSQAAASGGEAPVVAAPVVALGGDTSKDQGSATKKPEPLAESGGEGDLGFPSSSSPLGAEGDSSMCEEGGSAPTGCSTLKAPGPSCESFLDTKQMCSRIAKGLRPRVAEKAVDCLLAKSGRQSICDFRVGSECAISAVRKACIEPTTQSTCAPVVRACGGSLTMKDCQSLLSSVGDRYRRAMVSCMTEGCSIDYCMYDIE